TCSVLVFGIGGFSQERGFIAVFERSEIGQSRPCFEDLFVIAPKQFHVVADFRTRADDRHFFFYYVDQLGNFIDLGLTQNPPDPGDPPVFADGYKATACGSIPHHSAKLVNPKRTKASADSLLLEKNRSRRIQLYK